MKEKMREAKEEVESEQLNKLDISSGNLHRPEYNSCTPSEYRTLWFVTRLLGWDLQITEFFK